LDNPDIQSEEDMLSWKREYAIRDREAEWKKRQDERLMQKQVSWEVHRLEKENRLAAAREAARRKHCEERLALKHNAVEREYKERCRDIAISKRTEHWDKAENDRLYRYVTEAREKEEQKATKLCEDKERRAKELLEATTQKAEVERQEAELAEHREHLIKQREDARQTAAVERTKKLKLDADAEKAKRQARYAHENPYPIKSVLRTVIMRAPMTAETRELEAKREANLEKKRREKDQNEVARILKCKQQRAKELDRFKGPSEQDIMLRKVPIFGTTAV